MTNVNMDAKIKIGGRKTTDPSLEGLKRALYNAYKKYAETDEIVDEEVFFEAIESPSETDEYYDVWDGIRAILYYHPKISKDIQKVDFDLENLFCCRAEGDEYGFDQFGDLTVLKCMGGGDWQQPVYFVVYFDGKSLRAYIPTKGNTYNTLNKCAFGEDDECDEEFFEKHGIYFDDDTFFGDEIEWNMNTMIEDITARIEIV